MSNQCKLCSSTELRLMHGHARDGQQIVACNLWKCDRCHIVFLESNVTQRQLVDYYTQGHFRNSYLPDMSDQDSKESQKFYSLKQPLQEKRFSLLKDMFQKDMEVLDVGCATAGFLNIVRNHVKHVKGVELYKPHVDFAQHVLGLDVSMMDVMDLEGDKFDVICMFHVLEHIPDPIVFLKGVYTKLKKGGRLIIEVPNVSDPLISIYNLIPYKNFYFIKPHLFYYDEDSMEFLLKISGFHQAEFRSYQHYGLMNHLCWALTGHTCTATKVGGGGVTFPDTYMDSPNLEPIQHFFDDMNKSYKKLLEDMKKADTLLVIARK